MSAFTPREAARDSFAAARSMGFGRVVGANAEEMRAARAETWRRVAGLIDRAAGTDRVFIREPDDARLEEMAGDVRAALDRLAG